MHGQIYKSLSGFYYIYSKGETFQTRARGVFRNKSQKPQVGDWVEFESSSKTDGVLTKIDPRKNSLIRPNVSNIDQAVVVMSTLDPDFSTFLLDRFLIVLENNGIEPIIFITKMDLLQNESLMQTIKEVYEKIGYKIICEKNKKAAIDLLKPLFKDQLTIFMGQTGAGKSTLLNEIDPLLTLETGEISSSLGRGRHTTRHVELHPVCDGLIADTPGFSAIDILSFDQYQLPTLFREFVTASHACKFRECSHTHEPHCEVKRLLALGEISDSRYESYIQFLEEIKGTRAVYKKQVKKG